jgi:hypothetical protein
VSEPRASIGQQLDELGLASFDMPDGHRVEEATITLVTGEEGYGCEIHQPIRLPRQEPGVIPVPHPVERRIVTVVAEGQELSPEQRARLVAWLKANNVDPSRVTRGSITVECKMYGDRPGRQVIGFTEYYANPDGQREMNWKTVKGALTYQRWVEQTVPIEPDPTWKGWTARHAEIEATKAAAEAGAVAE